ncbi:MAG: DNA polymerase III subunit delta [Oscillospiraceae bacterium]|jgi:DNA polymerase-3 subunit delta|nr:DNA polymerase III subunit delta [Oscillospiraceae bacterium]
MSRLYYYYGKDIYTVGEETAKLLKKFGGSETRVQGSKDLDLSLISDNIMQYSMFAPYSVVYINDFNADDLSAEKTEKFFDILSNIPDTSKVIISVTGVDIYGGKKTITAKNKKLADFVKINGEVREFNLKTRAELIKMLQKDYPIQSNAANLLCEYCLDDTLSVMTEIEKLSCYTQNIDIQAVNIMVSKRLDTNAFALAKAVTAFDGRTVFRLLDELFTCQAEPIPIWSAISSSFIDLYRAKTAVQCGKNQQIIEQDFNYKGKSFVVTNAIRAVQRISPQKLRYCLQIITQTDMLLKSSPMDKRILMDIALTKMLVK